LKIHRGWLGSRGLEQGFFRTGESSTFSGRTGRPPIGGGAIS
jgi:hypothetical protein